MTQTFDLVFFEAFQQLLTNGLPPREDRIDIVFAAGGSNVLRMKHDSTGQLFVTANALSEFLLVRSRMVSARVTVHRRGPHRDNVWRPA